MHFEHLRIACLTDVGRKRDHNEDSILCLPVQGIFCVADGMGGMAAGDIASRLVVESVRDHFSSLPVGESARPDDRVAAIAEALKTANRRIRAKAVEMGLRGVGSTAVVAAFDPQATSRLGLLHAGDSRAYRHRKGSFVLLTQDHSVASAIGVDESKLATMFRGVITRAVGTMEELEPEQTNVEVQNGDTVLLCSDGLTRMVPDARIAELLGDEPGKDLEGAARRLVAAANEAGGDDNVSVILIAVQGILSTPAVSPAEDVQRPAPAPAPAPSPSRPPEPAAVKASEPPPAQRPDRAESEEHITRVPAVAPEPEAEGLARAIAAAAPPSAPPPVAAPPPPAAAPARPPATLPAAAEAPRATPPSAPPAERRSPAKWLVAGGALAAIVVGFAVMRRPPPAAPESGQASVPAVAAETGAVAQLARVEAPAATQTMDVPPAVVPAPATAAVAVVRVPVPPVPPEPVAPAPPPPAVTAVVAKVEPPPVPAVPTPVPPAPAVTAVVAKVEPPPVPAVPAPVPPAPAVTAIVARVEPPPAPVVSKPADKPAEPKPQVEFSPDKTTFVVHVDKAALDPFSSGDWGAVDQEQIRTALAKGGGLAALTNWLSAWQEAEQLGGDAVREKYDALGRAASPWSNAWSKVSDWPEKSRERAALFCRSVHSNQVALASRMADVRAANRRVGTLDAIPVDQRIALFRLGYGPRHLEERKTFDRAMAEYAKDAGRLEAAAKPVAQPHLGRWLAKDLETAASASLQTDRAKFALLQLMLSVTAEADQTVKRDRPYSTHLRKDDFGFTASAVADGITAEDDAASAAHFIRLAEIAREIIGESPASP